MNDIAESRASWKDWLAAYVRAYELLPDSSSDACPNCGARTLNLAFTGLVADRVGYASFWCSTCLFGIHLSRVPVPDDAPMDSVYAPERDRNVTVPDYTVVPESVDDDDESFRF